MQTVPIKLGPLALLLTVISICLTVLSILTFSTARADLALADKYADTVSTRYALEQQGSEALAQLAETGAPDASWEVDEEGIYHRTFSQDGFLLRVGVTEADDGWDVVSWRQEKEWEADTSIGNLW